MKRRAAKDRKTTSAELGFKVSGYCHKDPVSGDVISKEFKFNPPKEGIEPIFRKLFSNRAADG